MRKAVHTSPYFLAAFLIGLQKLCRYGTGAARESIAQTFFNQASELHYITMVYVHSRVPRGYLHLKKL